MCFSSKQTRFVSNAMTNGQPMLIECSFKPVVYTVPLRLQQPALEQFIFIFIRYNGRNNTAVQ